MDQTVAIIIYEELRRTSAAVLDALGMLTEPHKPVVRTCKFKYEAPRGILYHYTGGPSGLKSMRWANDPSWGNKGSSWHVTILDRIPQNKLGDLWIIHASTDLRRWFPAPTIIMADWRWGTWHGNWTNNMTLGIENRNTGYWGYKKLASGLSSLGKTGVRANGKLWEPYTREQIISNINIGRVLNGYVGGNLDPDWILTHQCVWATKADTGPTFPIHTIRNEIFNDRDLSHSVWLGSYKMAPDDNVDDDLHWEQLDEDRGEGEFVPWATPRPGFSHSVSLEWVSEQLYKIGFNSGPEMPPEANLTKMVRWFQRSTGAFRKSSPSKVLKPDGIVGPRTATALKQRLSALGIS